MKKCPNGHIYPDALPQCPVCEKADALKTRYYKTVFKGRVPPGVPGSLNTKQPTFIADNKDKNGLDPDNERKTEDPPKIFDADKTILIGQTEFALAAGLGGWLVEMNSDGIPVKSYELYLHKKHHVGRGEDNDVVLSNSRQSISRRHCMIEYKAPYFILHDNNSANGTKVNDAPVTSQSLADMDIIVLGDQRYRIKYLQPPEE